MPGFANNLLDHRSLLAQTHERRRTSVQAGVGQAGVDGSDTSRRLATPGGAPSRTVRSSRTGPRLSPADKVLLAEVMAEPMDFMPNEEFSKPGAEKRIYHAAAPVPAPDVRWYRPLMDDLGGSKRESTPRRGDSVVLTAAQERVIFMQYNYARFRVRAMQDALAGRAPSVQKSRAILQWYRTAHRLREQIAETNLALVLAMAKRVRIGESDYGDLISEGNMALMRSVDKFDCARGFKFSTYGCRAILKAFSRHGMKLAKYRSRFPSEFDPAMEKSNHAEEMREQRARESAAEVRHIVESNRADLNEIERAVIVHRFGLDRAPDTKQPTLAQVGEEMGVTKERVRQIQNRALEKIRLALEAVSSPAAAGPEDAAAADITSVN